MGSIVVPPGITLTIEPGVKVKFKGNYFIYVDGTLKAIGTPAENIIFTTDIPYWGNIYFRDSSTDATFDTGRNYADGCTLQYCVVEYAQGPDGAIKTRNASPFINFCTVQYNKCRAIEYNGKTDNKITNCLIRNNLGGGLNIAWGTTPITISGNRIINNTVSGSGGGISFQYSGNLIKNNIILNNVATDKGGGIYNYEYKNTIINNIIAGNSAKNGGGSYGNVIGSSISSNHFVNNIANNDSAIYSPAPNIFLNNLFINNKSSITPSESIGLSGVSTITSNNILNNNTTYSVRNYNGSDINMQNNWWNTTVQAQIEATIFDKLDENSKGLITFIPFLDTFNPDAPISPPQNVQISSGTRVKLSWDANPEPDTAGYRIYWSKKPGFEYENSRDVGKVTSYEFLDLPPGKLYFAVTAYDKDYNYANDDPATPVNENQTGYAKDKDDPATPVIENQTGSHESWFSAELSGKKSVSVSPAPWLLLLLEN
jgi:parallel beta-helix repeat protein